MKHKFTFSTETIFPAIVTLFSIINLTSQYEDIVSFSALLSVIGILGTILYFTKQSIAIIFIYIWIIAQIIIIDPIWNLSQVFNFNFGFNLGTAKGNYGINLNVIPLLYLGFLKVLKANNLIGKKIMFKEFRESEFGNIFPLTGIITKRVALGNEKNWLLVTLDLPFAYDNIEIQNVLIRRKDEKVVKLKTENQIAFFRLVYKEHEVSNHNPDINKFPFIDWVLCEC